MDLAAGELVNEAEADIVVGAIEREWRGGIYRSGTDISERAALMVGKMKALAFPFPQLSQVGAGCYR